MNNKEHNWSLIVIYGEEYQMVCKRCGQTSINYINRNSSEARITAEILAEFPLLSCDEQIVKTTLDE